MDVTSAGLNYSRDETELAAEAPGTSGTASTTSTTGAKPSGNVRDAANARENRAGGDDGGGGSGETTTVGEVILAGPGSRGPADPRKTVPETFRASTRARDRRRKCGPRGSYGASRSGR